MIAGAVNVVPGVGVTSATAGGRFGTTPPNSSAGGVVAGGFDVPAVETMLTSSTTTVAVALVSWLVTASPTYTSCSMMSCADPIEVQVNPSCERNASKLLPARVNRTQPGTPPSPPSVCSLDPPTCS